jgi:hypothetical protein
MRGAAALLVLPAGWAAPALTQDATEGRRLAEQRGANCHPSRPAGPASDAVPSFMGISAQPGRTVESPSAFLRAPHGARPDHGPALRQSEHLAACLLLQRPC